MKINILLFTLAFFALVTTTNAQKTYEIKGSNQVYILGSPSDFDISGYIVLKNISDKDAYFEAILLSADLPNGFEADLCNNSGCYPNLPDTVIDYIPVSSGNEGSFKLDVRPNNSVGLARVKYLIRDTAVATSVVPRDTLDFIISTDASYISTINQKIAVSIFPNPATENLNITVEENEVCPINPTTIEVLNVGGQIVISDVIISAQTSLNVESLNAGVYLVRLRNKEGMQTVEKFIKK